MSRKYRTVTVTFDELVAYGREHATSVQNGIPWSFHFMGMPVTHETDDEYLISDSKGVMHSLKRGQEMDVVQEIGDTFIKVDMSQQACPECGGKIDVR